MTEEEYFHEHLHVLKEIRVNKIRKNIKTRNGGLMEKA